METLGDLDALQAGRHLFRGQPPTEADAHVIPHKMAEPCERRDLRPDARAVHRRRLPPYRQWIALPPLGYCSIIIFESIGNHSVYANGSVRSKRLDEFLRLAKPKIGWAEFGVAFDFGSIERTSEQLSRPNGTRLLAPLEENGIVHYGVFSYWSETSDSVKKHKATLDLFEVLRRHQRRKDAGRQHLSGGLVYAVKMLPSYSRQLLEIIDHIVKDFKVDMFVAVTHMQETYQYTFDCKITGPTTWNDKYDSRELPIYDTIARLRNRGYLDLDIPVAVSFTLKGFWYRPEKTDDDSDFAPGKPCGYLTGSSTLGSYAEVCDVPFYEKQMTAVEAGHFLNYTFFKEYERTFVFDSLRSIAQKVVLAHRAYRGLSFALFDIDYEDVFNECPGNVYGAFDRVAAVRWLTDRLKEIQKGNAIPDTRTLVS
ncbi:hypothetical protein MTO96_044112 [Rhipicephalus appendiculatus]